LFVKSLNRCTVEAEQLLVRNRSNPLALQPFQVLPLIYKTAASRATILFAAGLAVGAEAFVGLRAPIDAAGEGIVLLAGALIIHFLAAQVAAGDLELG
jgi:hypothetical protein